MKYVNRIKLVMLCVSLKIKAELCHATDWHIVLLLSTNCKNSSIIH